MTPTQLRRLARVLGMKVDVWRVDPQSWAGEVGPWFGIIEDFFTVERDDPETTDYARTRADAWKLVERELRKRLERAQRMAS